jgi:hypothetical protein
MTCGLRLAAQSQRITGGDSSQVADRVSLCPEAVVRLRQQWVGPGIERIGYQERKTIGQDRAPDLTN